MLIVARQAINLILATPDMVAVLYTFSDRYVEYKFNNGSKVIVCPMPAQNGHGHEYESKHGDGDGDGSIGTLPEEEWFV